MQQEEVDWSSIGSLKANDKICKGRVDNLEDLVLEDWWTSVFDQMYLKTDGDVVEDMEITMKEIQLLTNNQAVLDKLETKGSKVLDLCCGQGRHSLQLGLEFPALQIFGHDQSEYLINLAIERAEERKMNKPLFTVGDCRSIPYPDEYFDLVIVMGNSFGYFKQDDANNVVVNEIRRVMAKDAILVLDLTDGKYMKENYQPRSWEWIDDRYFCCRERSLSKDGTRLNSREVICDSEKGVVRDQFYQERLFVEEELWALLEPLGFKNACTDSQIKVVTGLELSKRNEDLGMMACRMLLFAQRTEQVQQIGRVKRFSALSLSEEKITNLIPELCLFLGDTKISCKGKLNDTWNEDDYLTREKLLEVLKELGYSKDNLTIIQDHKTLLQTMVVSPPKFVFNLCDEGFMNDALQELHLPALLDMLHIKYSGAGPSCLAFCYDKQITNRTASAIGIPVPKETFFGGRMIPEMIVPGTLAYRLVHFDIVYPSFVKPSKGDNSLGITTRSIVQCPKELVDYAQELFEKYGFTEILVQEYLPGPEYSVGLLGNVNNFQRLPILQVDFTEISNQGLPPILGFESKWDPTSPYWSKIHFKEANRPELYKLSETLFARFECKDYARFDFRCDRNGAVKLLEVNPNPGWCWDGKMNKMAALSGISYKELISIILKSSYARIKSSQKSEYKGH